MSNGNLSISLSPNGVPGNGLSNDLDTFDQTLTLDLQPVEG
jgi:hypothetical protein